MTISNTFKWLLKEVHRLFFFLFLSFYVPVKPLDKRGNGAVVAIALLSTALSLYTTLLCDVTLAHIALKTGTQLTHDIALYYALYTSAAIGFAAFYYAYLAGIVSKSDLSTAKFGGVMTALLALFGLVFYFTSLLVTIVH